MNHILQLHFKRTQRGMMRKLKVTSGLLQENSFIVIALYPESNCTCRKKNHFPSQSITPTSFQQTLITCHQIQRILVLVLCCMSLRTMKLWLRWLPKVEVPQWGMFHGPTQLLWIGCLTRLIWIPKFKSVTLTPNTNSQTCWLKGISHLISGTIFFICSLSVISVPLAALRISAWRTKTMVKRMQEQTEGERVVSKSRPAVMNMSFIATSSSAASSPIASKSPGMPIASGKPTAGWVLNEAHLTQRRRLKCDSRVHTLAGWWRSSVGTRRIKKKKNQKTLTILRLRPGIAKNTLLPKIVKLGSNRLHTDSVLQLTRKVKRIQKRHGTTISTYRRTHRTLWKPSSPWSGKSMETTWRSCGRFEYEFGYLVNVHEYHSSSISISRTRLWHEFEICKELSLENNGTAFQRSRKADQWSDRNHWHKPDQFPRFEVGIDKLVARSNLSIFHCQCLRLLQLCSLFGKDGRRSCRILEEQNYFTGRIIFMSMFNDVVWDSIGNDEKMCK